jgi:hypothetical protein
MIANPTIDGVMTEVLDAIKSSCAPLEIDADAISAFVDTFQPRFDARLKNGSWHIDRNNVLQAARQCGVIANAIATLRHQENVDSPIFLEAGELVRKHCHEVFREGVWCS